LCITGEVGEGHGRKFATFMVKKLLVDVKVNREHFAGRDIRDRRLF
jgi:hypothetical protein